MQEKKQVVGQSRVRLVMGLSAPIFIELLLQMLVGNADQIMVGRVFPDGVGAIGNANQVTNLLLLVFSVIGSASTILISQYIGAKDTKRVSETYVTALAMNTVFGLLVSLILIFGCGPIFRMMGVHQEIFESTCLYMRIIGSGMLFQSLYLTFTAFFRSQQMMKETMLVSILMNCLNIFGNAVLIYGWFGLPAMGIAGAAVSSTLSRLVGMAVIARCFVKKIGFGRVEKGVSQFSGMQLKKLLRIGVPTGGEALSYNLSQICVQTVCNRFPTYVVNTRVYAGLFANVSYLFASATGQACQVVAARLIGEGRVEDTDRTVMRTMWLGLGVTSVISVTLYLLCEPLYALFTDDPRVIALAKTIMLVEIPLELARVINMVVCWALQACGDIAYPASVCVIYAWLIGVGCSFFFGVVLDWGLAGVWAAMALDEAVRAALLLVRWRKRAWAKKCLLTEDSHA